MKMFKHHLLLLGLKFYFVIVTQVVRKNMVTTVHF